MSKNKIENLRLRKMQKSTLSKNASSQNSFADLIKMAGLDKSHPEVFDNSVVNSVVAETERERPVTLLEVYESGRKERVRKYELAHKKDRQSKATLRMFLTCVGFPVSHKEQIPSTLISYSPYLR